MKRESKYLLTKAVDSLVLSVEHYNRPSDRGRVHTVLILLDHAFEMFLKAAIIHRGGKIRKAGQNQTITIKACFGKATSEKGVQFLTQEQGIQLRTLNGLRDAAQHYLLDLSEQHLYIHVQAGFTLFRDIYSEVFGRELSVHLPNRVMPVSTSPPIDINAVFERDTKEIQLLLKPRKRQGMAIRAKLRGLAILEEAIQGSDRQPSDRELNKYGDAVAVGKEWTRIFPGVATIQFTATGSGPSLDLRISKRDGFPIQLVAKGTPGVDRVAIQKFDSLGFYNLGRNLIAKKIGLTGPKTTALIWHLKMKDNPDYFKRVTIDKSSFDRYSQKAIERLRQAVKTEDIGEVWTLYRTRLKNHK